MAICGMLPNDCQALLQYSVKSFFIRGQVLEARSHYLGVKVRLWGLAFFKTGAVKRSP